MFTVFIMHNEQELTDIGILDFTMIEFQYVLEWST